MSGVKDFRGNSRPGRGRRRTTSGRLNKPPLNIKRDSESSSEIDEWDDTRKSRFEDFEKCRKPYNDLENSLEKFSNSVQQMGSAIHLLKASQKLKDEFKYLRSLFEINAAKLFPNKHHFHGRRNLVIPPAVKAVLRRSGGGPIGESDEKLRRLRLSATLVSLVETFAALLNAFDDFPEFINDEGRGDILDVTGVIQNWSTALKIAGATEGNQRFRDLVFQLTLHLAEYADTIRESLDVFMDVGIPCISAAQKRSVDLLTSTAGTATFLSGVTATTIQFTFMVNDDNLDVAINALWISSLFLSITAAFNSLLALAWRQAIYSTPGGKMPWWALAWFKQGSLGLLIVAVMAFLCGLFLFVLQTQNTICIWIIAGLYFLTLVGLGAMTIWFTSQRKAFYRLRELQERQHFQELGIPQKQNIPWFDSVLYPTFAGQAFYDGRKSGQTQAGIGRPSRVLEKERHKLANSGGPKKRWLDIRSRITPSPILPLNQDNETDLTWIGYSPNLIATDKVDGSIQHMEFSPSGMWLAACLRHSCVVYRLGSQSFKRFQTLSHESAHIKQAEWSPNGKLLLTMTKYGFGVWSADDLGNFALHKYIRCRAESEPKRVLWINNEEFLAMTNGSVLKLHIDGNDTEEYNLPGVGFNNPESGIITFTMDKIQLSPDPNQIFLIVNQDNNVLKYRNSRLLSWKHVIVFNLFTGKADYLRLSLDNIISVDASQDGRHLLFGYSDKLPDVCTLEYQGKKPELGRPHKLQSSKTLADKLLLGPAHIVGPSQKFIACTDANGKTYMWRRDDGTPIHTDGDAEQSELSPDLDAVITAWSPQGTRPVFAVWKEGGDLQLWQATSPSKPPNGVVPPPPPKDQYIQETREQLRGSSRPPVAFNTAQGTNSQQRSRKGSVSESDELLGKRTTQQQEIGATSEARGESGDAASRTMDKRRFGRFWRFW